MNLVPRLLRGNQEKDTHLIVEIKSDQYNAAVTEDLKQLEKGDVPIAGR